jgi:hypothetical protein
MTLTVDLPPPLEQRIRDRAAQLGGTPESIVANVVREHFSAEEDTPCALTQDETRWLKQANEVPATDVRERWRELDRLRRAEELTPQQQAEMVRLYDQIEAHHARRIEAAAELAKLWQVSLDSVIEQLGLNPADDDDGPSH